MKPITTSKLFSNILISWAILLSSQSPALANNQAATDDVMNSAYHLVDQMTLAEQIGQMTLIKFTMLQSSPDEPANYTAIHQYNLGGLLVAGGEVPGAGDTFIAGTNDPQDYLTSTQQNWLTITNKSKANLPTVQTAKQTVYIPLLLGIDAVHGAHTIVGSTTFPQNIGLSMTHDTTLMRQIEYWTAQDLAASGFNWAYAPTVAVSHNPNWGRYMETLGDQPEWIARYASAMTKGLQLPLPGTNQNVLATAKHFLGDGATQYGADEGNDNVADDAMPNFLKVNKTGYLGAINQGNAGSIMVSYSAINNVPMTFNKTLITSDLRSGRLLGQSFDGLIVSDYGAVDKASSQGLPATPNTIGYSQGLASAVDAGVDVFMLTSTAQDYQTAEQFQDILIGLVQSGDVRREKIRHAAAHVIAAKITMGLLHYDANTDTWQTKQPQLPVTEKIIGNQQEQQDATQIAEESFVLLKNKKGTLPLNSQQIKYIIFTGEQIINKLNDNNERIPTLFANYDNIGAQNGGWTVAWQGVEGNELWQDHNKTTSGASSIITGIHSIAPNAKLIAPHYSSNTDISAIKHARQQFLSQLANKYPDMTAKNTVIIGTLAELPTAEFMGDIDIPYCTDSQDSTNGCLYNNHLNAYTPDQQSKTLASDYSVFDQQVIQTVKQMHDTNIPLVTVLLSSRPRIITQGSNPLGTSHAFIAAWLPGTAGGDAIAQSLFGEYHFCDGNRCSSNSANTLSVPWVRDMTSLQNYPSYSGDTKGIPLYPNALFTIGYGLND